MRGNGQNQNSSDFNSLTRTSFKTKNDVQNCRENLLNKYNIWTENNVSFKIQKLVEENYVRINQELLEHAEWAANNCDMSSEKWHQLFLDNNIKSELSGGYFIGHYSSQDQHDMREGYLDFPGSSDHTWLVVENNIFDPTVKQFNIQKPSKEHYVKIDLN